uniref:Uncharacterized protein n=1 Tax=Ficedula albicollis TaxID=59894 RepID=A0A803VT12_FICAL
MAEDRGTAAPALRVPRVSPLPRGGPGLTPSVPLDVRFVTEESFDFAVLSPSDSQEEEEAEDSPGGDCRHGDGNGRWSPLRGARLEEMVREATRLAAQLEGCHLPPPDPGDPPGAAATPPGTPRSPRRQTFVVKDSPVRALLPQVVMARGQGHHGHGGSWAIPQPSLSLQASLRQGGAQSSALPTPASPTPGPPPPLSPPAVPRHPLPSPRCPLGLQQRVGGPPSPEGMPLPRALVAYGFSLLCRSRGSTGSPPNCCLGVQTRIPPCPPAAPPQDSGEQHPEVTPPKPPHSHPEALGTPGLHLGYLGWGEQSQGHPTDELRHPRCFGRRQAAPGAPRKHQGTPWVVTLQGRTGIPRDQLRLGWQSHPGMTEAFIGFCFNYKRSHQQEIPHIPQHLVPHPPNTHPWVPPPEPHRWAGGGPRHPFNPQLIPLHMPSYLGELAPWDRWHL